MTTSGRVRGILYRFVPRPNLPDLLPNESYCHECHGSGRLIGLGGMGACVTRCRCCDGTGKELSASEQNPPPTAV